MGVDIHPQMNYCMITTGSLVFPEQTRMEKFLTLISKKKEAMKMKINHYTVNTRHNRVSCAEEVQDETLEYLTNLINETDEGSPIELLDGATMDLTTEQGGYVATIKVGDDIVLATAGACNKLQAKNIWKQMMKIAEPAMPSKIELFPVQPPFVLDFIFPGALLHQDILAWTGDFTRCLGHLLLSWAQK